MMKIEVYDANNLNFVEMNITGDNDNYLRCDRESKYLDSDVFNLFVNCFESANKLYDYFGPTKYNSRKIIPLRNELIKSLELMTQVNSKELFISYIQDKFWGNDFMASLKKKDPAWENNYTTYLEKLKSVNQDLIKIAEKCADEERILWVIGY